MTWMSMDVWSNSVGASASATKLRSMATISFVPKASASGSLWFIGKVGTYFRGTSCTG